MWFYVCLHDLHLSTPVSCVVLSPEGWTKVSDVSVLTRDLATDGSPVSDVLSSVCVRDSNFMTLNSDLSTGQFAND